MKRCFAFLLVLSLLAGLLPVSAAGEEVFRISGPEDLRTLAELCVLDSRSVGLEVRLENDIDLEGEEFDPIPLFAGRFDGQGRSIRGLSLTGEGSVQGFFRQILPGGVVENLAVFGRVRPGGTAETVGGLCGVNRGSLLNCTFSGAVEGSRRVGGLCGLNEGTAADCAFEGSVSGQHQVGGVAGENTGTLSGCVNRGEVNPAAAGEPELREFDFTISAEEIVDVTDVGGVAGLSSGTLRDCENRGNVGRLHVGYNVGGVTGRLSGVTENCRNLGPVQGRKDVGGVVGQLDPDARWSFSESALTQLRDAVSALQREINALTEDVSAASGALSGNLTAALGALERSGDAAQALTESAVAWAAENMEALNELSRRVSAALEELEPVFASLEAFAAALPDAAQTLSAGFAALGEAAGLSGGAMADAAAALEDGETAAEDARRAAEALESGLADLRRGLGDPAEAQAALERIREGLTLLIGFRSWAEGELDTLLAALEALLQGLRDAAKDAVYGVEDDTEPFRPQEEEPEKLLTLLKELLSALREALRANPEALSGLKRGLEELQAGGAELLALPELGKFHSFLLETEDSFAALGEMTADLEEASRDARAALDDLQSTGDALAGAMALFASGLGQLGGALGALHAAAEGLEGMSARLAGQPAVQLTPPPLESEDRTALFASLQEANAALTALAGELDGSAVTADLRAISDRIFSVADLLLNTLDPDGEGDRITLEDVSAGHGLWSAGLVSGSRNEAPVEGETNVGGVAGAISIEVPLDQEDDLDLSPLLSGSASYLVYAAVTGCINAGEVTARRRSAGGVVGRMDYGAVLDCESGGAVRAAGPYAGGVAGYSLGTVENCRVRAEIAGDGYVGGVAGFGHDIRGCLCMPWIEGGAEYSGSVAGEADGAVEDNRYCVGSLGGVNGFSFEGQAEPVAYEELLELSDSPLFRTVTVTFRAEGETVERREVPFGGLAGRLPGLPDRDGKTWRWEDAAESPMYRSMTVEGRYVGPVTVLATSEEVPRFLAEGIFREGQTLLAMQVPAILETEDGDPPEAWTLAVTDYAGIITVHMHELREGTLYVRDTEGQTAPAACVRDGSYLVFPMVSGGTLSFVPGERAARRWLLPGAVVLGVLLAAAVLLLLLRRRAKRRSRNGPGTEEADR
ncbi:MAG: hypothetical protein IKP17_09540 [Oscillospiraceae bacterium]|nr:hypothetical protein [Oscillospiraceae bacterium]MBR4692986.1 hypothetical protein [Oscillospiraceae bacterium]